MTLALAIQTDSTRLLLAIQLPTYRPSSLLIAVAALLLAVMGLALDAVLLRATGAPVGTVAIWPTAAALGMVLGFLALEVRRL